MDQEGENGHRKKTVQAFSCIVANRDNRVLLGGVFLPGFIGRLGGVSDSSQPERRPDREFVGN